MLSKATQKPADQKTAAEDKAIISVVARLLQEKIRLDSSLAGSSTAISSRAYVFHSSLKPNIKIKAYILRCVKYVILNSLAEPVSSYLIAALIYIDRFLVVKPVVRLTDLNVHRIFLVSFMVAHKMYNDFPFYNDFFAEVGGISTKELNKLELEFMLNMDFNFIITPQEYEQYFSGVQSFMKPVEAVVPPSVPLDVMAPGVVSSAVSVPELAEPVSTEVTPPVPASSALYAGSAFTSSSSAMFAAAKVTDVPEPSRDSTPKPPLTEQPVVKSPRAL
jgi:hypothetical protein